VVICASSSTQKNGGIASLPVAGLLQNVAKSLILCAYPGLNVMDRGVLEESSKVREDVDLKVPARDMRLRLQKHP
jgi:hypothetical protein